MLYKCSECGYDVAEDAKYCQKCGAHNPFRDWANSPYFTRDSNGKLISITLVDQPCHRCGKMLKRSGNRVTQRDPKEEGEYRGEKDRPVYYHWCPDCYKKSREEHYSNSNNNSNGCLSVVLLVTSIVFSSFLCLWLFLNYN